MKTYSLTLSGAILAAVVPLSASTALAEDNQCLEVVQPVGWCATPQVRNHCQRKLGSSGSQPRRTLYLNKNGGNYAPGAATDAVSNTVAAIPITGGALPAYPFAADTWPIVFDCVQAYFEPYNLDVTDVEPAGDQTYIELAVGGKSSDIGYDSQLAEGVWGVASNDVFCEVDENGIAFSFAADHPAPTPAGRNYLCETIVHEAGHMLGLEHDIHPPDIMSYENNFTKDFIDIDSQCGEYASAPRNCCKDTGTQNTVKKLHDLVGPNEQELPVVTVTSPADGALVPPGFTVTADATDNFQVERVEVWIDGVMAGSDGDAPYEIETAPNVALGAHTLEVRAIDKSSNIGMASHAITIEAACTGDGDCADNEVCLDGACLGDVGAPCDQTGDCAGGICAAGDGFDKFCTHTCNEGASGECPDGFSCAVKGGGAAKCYPGGGSGGCLSVAGGRHAASGSAGLAFALLGLLAWRARRRA